MKKIVVMPDSFKGTLSSQTVCDIVRQTAFRRVPGCEVACIPVADGGEGTVDCFLTALGGQRIELEVTAPLGGRVQGFYGILPDGTAVIEMAAAAGLPLVAGREDPLLATTYGVGELMADALRRGCRRFVLGLGGSCTNDAGVGAAAALGVRFLNADGEAFLPTGGTLCKIAKIDTSGLLPQWRECELTVMCDIDNPLYGPTGAAYVFAPQKGANAQMVEELDQGLHCIGKRIAEDLQLEVSLLPGSGAAGGMGGGMAAFLGGKLKSGIETVLDLVDFETLCEGADLVLTGEGKLDAQSLGGKVVVGIARRAEKLSVPVVAVVGNIGEGAEQAYEQGVSAIFSINRAPMPFEEAKAYSAENLQLCVDNIFRLYLAAERGR